MRGPGRPRDTSIDRRVLEATAQILASEGWDALTIDGVAERAGVSRAAIYRRYANKADMAFHAAWAAFTPEPQYVDRAPRPPEGDTPEEVLHAVYDLAHASFHAIDRLGAFEGVMAQIILDREFNARIIAEAVGPAQELLEEVLRGHVERGVIADDVALGVVLDLFPAMLIYRRLVVRRPLTAQDVDALVRIVADGVRTGSE